MAGWHQSGARIDVPGPPRGGAMTAVHRLKRTLRHVPLVAAAALAVGCGDATAPVPPSLVGEWKTPTYPVPSGGSVSYWLSLQPDGAFGAGRQVVGPSGGPLPVDPVFEAYIGTFTAFGGRIQFRPVQLLTAQPTEDPIIFERATYEVSGDHLTLHYMARGDDSWAPATRDYYRFVPEPCPACE
jgi:hypothetical protein